MLNVIRKDIELDRTGVIYWYKYRSTMLRHAKLNFRQRFNIFSYGAHFERWTTWIINQET
jgi:hypothetical protein